MAKSNESKATIVNIMADGKIVEDLTGYKIPFTTQTEEAYKLMFSAANGIKFSEVGVISK